MNTHRTMIAGRLESAKRKLWECTYHIANGVQSAQMLAEAEAAKREVELFSYALVNQPRPEPGDTVERALRLAGNDVGDGGMQG